MNAREGVEKRELCYSVVAQRVKSLCLQCERPGFDPWVGKIPLEGKGYPLQYSGLENYMDCMVRGFLQARILEWVAFPFSRGIFPTQGSNPGLLHCRQILYKLSHQGRPQCKESP